MLEDSELLRERIDLRRQVCRGDDGVGMAVEGDDQCDAAMLVRVGDGLPDDLLVPEMHAVEDADGETDLASVRLEFGGLADQLHGIGFLP